MATELSLHRGDLKLDLGHPTLDISLRSIRVTGEWIEGDVEVKARVLGKDLDKTQHFKTRNKAATDIDLGLGAQLRLTAHLENPHRVCATAGLHWGPVNVSTPDQCVDV